MGGEHDGLAPRETSPEPKPMWGSPEPLQPELATAPEHVELGRVSVGMEKTFEVAVTSLIRGNGVLVTTLSRPDKTIDRPSVFRDKLGLDPEQALDDADASTFTLASPPTTSLIKHQRMPIRIRFKPNRRGEIETVVELRALGSDGSMDRKQIRVSGTGVALRGVKPKPDPKIVDTLVKPDPQRAHEEEGELVEPIHASSFENAKDHAAIEARKMAGMQQAGVESAADKIASYSEAPPPVSALDQLVEIALMMGVSGVAGVVAKYVAKQIASAIARPVIDTAVETRPDAPFFKNKLPNPQLDVQDTKPSGDKLPAMIADGLKDGLKNGVKTALKAKGGSSAPSAEQSNPRLDFVDRYRQMLVDLQGDYETTVADLAATVKDYQHGTIAMEAVASALAIAASTAMEDQERTMGLGWISAVARHSLGERDAHLPDGSTSATTKMEGALSYGARGWYKETSVPKHDGILDIDVDLPAGNTPLEESTFEVRGASIMGVSQEIAERLKTTKLDIAGIPIRLVVHGHPALITRDEVGRVRVNGYLLTEHGAKFTEAHMHKAASLLVDRVLSKTLAQWGVTEIKTDDATGLKVDK